MPTIYLHIGRGQTGTTTIQRFLSRNRDGLRQHGVHYVKAADSTGGGHQDFAKSFILDPPTHMVPSRQPHVARRRVVSEIRRSSSPTILLSSENFALADAGAVRAFFAEFVRVDGVKIILFVRSQDELAESEYNQLVRSKRENRPFGEYLAARAGTYDFMALAEKWMQHFGSENLVGRLYDGSRRDIVQRLLSCLPAGASFIPSHVGHAPRLFLNSSLGFNALDLARKLNEFELPFRSWIYRRLFTRLAEGDLPALLFGSEEARAFRVRFAESNRRFTELFLSGERSDLGGRRYSDSKRDEIRQMIENGRTDSL